MNIFEKKDIQSVIQKINSTHESFPNLIKLQENPQKIVVSSLIKQKCFLKSHSPSNELTKSYVFLPFLKFLDLGNV
jgi:hypothetical protein